MAGKARTTANEERGPVAPDKRRSGQARSDLRDQDTPGTHPREDKTVANIPLVPGEDDDDRLPEGLVRERKGPMNPTTGRKGESEK